MAVPREEKNINAVDDFADVNQGACARKTGSDFQAHGSSQSGDNLVDGYIT
jgi:hypothetical protein